MIHAILVRQEHPADEDSKFPSSIYHIFERLNTGGMKLYPQEIRSAIYPGGLNDLLRELNTDANWRNLFGQVSQRMRDQELILRFLALYLDGANYEEPMKEFLNRFMRREKDFAHHSRTEMHDAFHATVAVIDEHLGREAFRGRRQLNASLCDALMVGVARRLADGSITDPKALRSAWESLVGDQEFIDSISSGTTDASKVRTRMRLAEEVLATVP